MERMINMNNSYYQNPIFPLDEFNNEKVSDIFSNQLPKIEENNKEIFIYNNDSIYSILRLNNGKKVILYLNDNQNNSNFNGILEKTSKEYIVLSEPSSGKWYLIPIGKINYIVFEEKINFNKDIL